MNNNLIHYSTHTAMLKKVIVHKPISEEEYTLLSYLLKKLKGGNYLEILNRGIKWCRYFVIKEK